MGFGFSFAENKARLESRIDLFVDVRILYRELLAQIAL